MKKIAYFACDIAGTFSTHLKGQELHDYFTKFVEQLEQIRKENGADELIFSFFTADNSPAYLFKYVYLLKPYINGTTIKLGNQFMNNGCFGQDGREIFLIGGINKIEEMKKDVKFLQKENEIVWLGYADDSVNHKSIIELLLEFPEIPVVYGLIPSQDTKHVSDMLSISPNNNLEGLVDSLANYLDPTIIKIKIKDRYLIQINNMETEKQTPQIRSEEKEQLASNQTIIYDSSPSIIYDDYDYLKRLGFKIHIGIIPDEEINFLVGIHKKLDLEEEIPKGTITRLRKLKDKYQSGASRNGEPDDNYYRFYEYCKCVDYLLSKMYDAGYMHKYSPNEIDDVLRKTSILALSLAAPPNYIIKRLEKYNIDIEYSSDGYIAHRAAPKNRFYRLCNLHTERTPSLLLYEDTSSFHCFGCGRGGNSFSFLMDTEEMSFIEAVETLARAFNVALSSKTKTKERPDIIEKILKALASDYYLQLLEESKARTIATYGEYPISYDIKPKKLELILPEDYSMLDDDDDDENLPF